MGAVPGVEVDLAEDASAAALLVRRVLPAEADGAREAERVFEAFVDALELFAQAGRAHVRERPVPRVVQRREAGAQQAADVVERRRRVKVGAMLKSVRIRGEDSTSRTSACAPGLACGRPVKDWKEVSRIHNTSAE